MKKRVCFDPGHGGDQPGAIYRGLKEKDVVLSVAIYAAEGLRAVDPGLWVFLTRTWNETLSLGQRCTLANNMRVDCFISIHCNADPDHDQPGDPEARGEEIWVHKGSAEGLRLAKCLAGEIDQIFPKEPFRGIKETESLYVLKHTRAPACLIEIGFIDKSSSVEAFTNDLTLKRIGALIARGIYQYLKGESNG